MGKANFSDEFKRDAVSQIKARHVVRTVSKLAGIKAQIGYKRRIGSYGGRPSVVVDNTLDRQFDVNAPDTVWVTDIRSSAHKLTDQSNLLSKEMENFLSAIRPKD